MRCSLRTPVAWGPRPHPPGRSRLQQIPQGPGGRWGWAATPGPQGRAGPCLSLCSPPPTRTHMLVTARPTCLCTQVQRRARICIYEQLHGRVHTRTLCREGVCTHTHRPGLPSRFQHGPHGVFLRRTWACWLAPVHSAPGEHLPGAGQAPPTHRAGREQWGWPGFLLEPVLVRTLAERRACNRCGGGPSGAGSAETSAQRPGPRACVA